MWNSEIKLKKKILWLQLSGIPNVWVIVTYTCIEVSGVPRCKNLGKVLAYCIVSVHVSPRKKALV